MTVTALTHDTASLPDDRPGWRWRSPRPTSFGLSGVLARGLLDTGWSAGATVALRIAIAAAVLVVPGALALRGRWHLVRANAGLIAVYGVAAVAGAQLCYFYAVTYMQVERRPAAGVHRAGRRRRLALAAPRAPPLAR